MLYDDGLFCGSSPHKWGIQGEEHIDEEMLRFIPTQVGNTSSSPKSPWHDTVHPHTSGEYSLSVFFPPAINGSSPHKWGILLVAQLGLFFDRFIPTQVGNTRPQTNAPRFHSVHPHTSGEYGSGFCFGPCVAGSSPHKWGILALGLAGEAVYRFIPTQVGNTQQGCMKRRHCLVHPHTSGEYN